MDYIKVAKESVSQWWNNKYLWVVGILGTVLSNLNINYDADTFRSLSEKSDEYQQIITSLGVVAAIIGCVFFIISIIGIYLSYRANAGMIISGKKIHQGEKLNFSTVWSDGSKGVGTLFVQSLILFGPIFLAIIAGIILTVILGIVAAPLIFIGMFCFICLVIPFMLVVSVLAVFAARISLLKGVSAWEGIKESWKFLLANVGHLLIFWLITLIVSTVGAMIIAPIIFIGSILLLTPATILLAANPVLGIVLMLGAGLLIGIITSLINGPIASLTNLYWTKVYLEIEKA